MIVQMNYVGRSSVISGLRQSHVALSTNTLREAVYLSGTLSRPLLFREALSALHAVVVSDYKYRPRDHFEFKIWLDEQDQKFLASLALKGQKTRERMLQLEERLRELNRARDDRRKDFYRARLAYFQYVYESSYERFLVLDPVITVHPDEVSFEAFSRDESTYARLAAKLDLFGNVGTPECGTTNIDFSTKLHQELERMRSYRSTRFDIAPSGLTVTTDGAATREKKINLPDSWVMGFHQVQSTMTLGLTHFRMATADLYNICRTLRRRKARKSPRALRYELAPGQRVRVVLEPWEEVIELTETARFDGPKPMSVRTWGRDRLRLLARLIPVCNGADVYLAGYGLPTIYVLDLGPLVFTLALSGWTDNDWTGGATKFDLLSRRPTTSAADLERTYEALRAERRATDDALATATGLNVEKVRGALSYLCQVGRAMYDLGGKVYRQRDLFPGPFSARDAAAAVKPTSPEEIAAKKILDGGNVRIIARRPVLTGHKVSGSARGANDPERVRPQLHIDAEGRIIEASCTCAAYRKAQMTKGPCEHILALWMAHMKKSESESS